VIDLKKGEFKPEYAGKMNFNFALSMTSSATGPTRPLSA